MNYNSPSTGDLNRHLRSIHLQMKPILCPCCNRKFAKQETLLRHLNTAHRSKPGCTTAILPGAEITPNYNMTQGEDKQTTISVVTTTNGGNISNSGSTLVVSDPETAQNQLNKIDITAPAATTQASQKQTLVPDPPATSALKAPTTQTTESVVKMAKVES